MKKIELLNGFVHKYFAHSYNSITSIPTLNWKNRLRIDVKYYSIFYFLTKGL